MRTFLTLLFASCFMLVAATAMATPPYYAPGDYQGWDIGTAVQLVDDGTNGDLVAGDLIYSATVNIATAGAYQWKAAEAGWAASWPGSGNSWFITTADNQDVLFQFYEDVAMGDGWAPDGWWPVTDATVGNTYNLVGSLGDELGGADWDPANAVLIMHDDGLNGDVTAGDGIYTFCGMVSLAGNYEWKVAVNGAWDQQFGVDGPGVNSATWFIDVLNDNDPWCFFLDTNTGRIKAAEDIPVAVESKTWGAVKALY